ncbi:MAG: hypothetical protein ACRDDH_07885 [Cetobacterium sp.]|uniref:hypothetical protein n=1 Tax=Cetobacterium sp. TaxID=2071632 RepID=UPI003EE61340
MIQLIKNKLKNDKNYREAVCLKFQFSLGLFMFFDVCGALISALCGRWFWFWFILVCLLLKMAVFVLLPERN